MGGATDWPLWAKLLAGMCSIAKIHSLITARPAPFFVPVAFMWSMFVNCPRVLQNRSGPTKNVQEMLGKLNSSLGYFFSTGEIVGRGDHSQYGAILAWEGGSCSQNEPALLPF